MTNDDIQAVTAQRDYANLILGIMLACEQRVWWLDRIMRCV